MVSIRSLRAQREARSAARRRGQRVAPLASKRSRWMMRGALVGAGLVAAVASASGAAHDPGPRPIADARDVPSSPLDLSGVTFGQRRDRMVLKLTTAGDWRPEQLLAPAGRSICVNVFNSGLPNPQRRICVLPAAGASTRLLSMTLHQDGSTDGVHALKAIVSRPDARSLDATFMPAAAGLRAGPYSWQAETDWTDAAACQVPGTCVDRAPNGAPVSARIVPVVVEPEGCVAHGPTQRYSGARASRRVALTFDDGPSRFTPAILHVLEREHVPGTFFMIGNQVPGHGALLHRMLHDGSMIANHSLTHANLAGAGASAVHQIAATQAIIRRASGFEPCLFRPPYGATSGALSRIARSHGALSILWDVDPQDWRTPGSGAIVSTVMRQARPGSIVLMHDGGGPRGQTLAALPTIIHRLRHRGLQLVTVTQLLHLRLRERAAG